MAGRSRAEQQASSRRPPRAPCPWKCRCSHPFQMPTCSGHPPPLNTHPPRAHRLHIRGPNVWACGGLVCITRGQLVQRDAVERSREAALPRACQPLSGLLGAWSKEGGWAGAAPGAPQGMAHEREPTFPRVRGSRKATAPAGSPAEGPTLKEAVGEAPASTSSQAPHCDLSSSLQADHLSLPRGHLAHLGTGPGATLYPAVIGRHSSEQGLGFSSLTPASWQVLPRLGLQLQTVPPAPAAPTPAR